LRTVSGGLLRPLSFLTVALLAVMAAALAAAGPLQARPLTIVAIGASNTTGFGVGEQNAYPAVLQALLRKKGIAANVINAGVNGDVTSGMLRRIDQAVPQGTDIVILQPGGNDLRFFGTKAARTANIAAMAKHVRARGIRVIVYDPDPVPADFYQWDHIHFNAAAHAKIAATLAVEIAATVKPAAPKRATPAAPAPAKP
jgi:acyl-CoA thioesterase-1